jgi:hypothetical protein
LFPRTGVSEASSTVSTIPFQRFNRSDPFMFVMRKPTCTLPRRLSAGAGAFAHVASLGSPQGLRGVASQAAKEGTWINPDRFVRDPGGGLGT